MHRVGIDIEKKNKYFYKSIIVEGKLLIINY